MPAGAKFRASLKSAPGNFVPPQNFQITTPLSRIFGGADGGAKSAPCNSTRIAPHKFLMPCTKAHSLASLQDRLRNGAVSLVAQLQHYFTRCVAKVCSCSTKWRGILCCAVEALSPQKGAAFSTDGASLQSNSRFRISSQTHYLKFRLKKIAYEKFRFIFTA